MPLAQQFGQDHQGRRFADVMVDERVEFAAILAFFDDPDRQRRMVESEEHHDRPALAGVVRELEDRPDVHQFFLSHDGHTTTRFRQAVGVVVRIVMENHGWRTTGLGRCSHKCDAPHYDTRGIPQHGWPSALVHPGRAIRVAKRDVIPVGPGAGAGG